MRPTTEKELKFLRKWEIQRQRKWRYILVPVILFGLNAGIFSYLWHIDFDLIQFDALRLTSNVIVFSLVGFAFGWLNFRGQEKRYRELKDANLI